MCPSSNIVNWPRVFHHFQEQAQLGHFHGLRVHVHAVNVVEQNALLLVHAQAIGLVILRQQYFILQMFVRVVLGVPIQMPVQ